MPVYLCATSRFVLLYARRGEKKEERDVMEKRGDEVLLIVLRVSSENAFACLLFATLARRE
jgi:hypothetical protein